jgi:hypothetical protein
MSNHLPLRDKVSALVDLADRIGLPLELVAECITRMMDGHREHNDAHRINCAAEAACEALDIVNYAAIARARGDQSQAWVDIASGARALAVTLGKMRGEAAT